MMAQKVAKATVAFYHQKNLPNTESKRQYLKSYLNIKFLFMHEPIEMRHWLIFKA